MVVSVFIKSFTITLVHFSMIGLTNTDSLGISINYNSPPENQINQDFAIISIGRDNL